MDWKCLIIASTILCGCMEVTEGSNILVVMPLSARSHFISFQPFWEELVKKGHNLTIIAGYKLNDKFKANYTLVDVKPVFSKWTMNVAATRYQNLLYNQLYLHHHFQEFIDEILKYSDVQDLIKSNDKYDLVIAEMLFIDAIFAFGYKFNAPVMTVSPVTSMLLFDEWILGNPSPSAHFPSRFLPFTERMSLWNRIVNTIYRYVIILYYEFISLPKAQVQIEKYFHFEKENTPRIKDIVKSISVSLVTSHYSFGYAKPDLPNVVNIAGLHLTPPGPLSKEIQQFMDEAEHGVIYLSLGTFIDPNKLEDLGLIFIGIMENLPQRVIMKWNSSLIPNIPKNFLVQDWISQDAVLNHPKCRLFITHGGLHSSLEAVNASVPLIVVPFFADQQFNRVIIEYYEIGTAVQVDDVPKQLLSKIQDVLENPKYKKNMIKRSLIFRDRPNTPLETAMYWVDHVLKHKDTVHLKSASVEYSWYDLYSLGVFVILAVIIYIILKTVKLVIRRMKQKLSFMKDRLFSNIKSAQTKKVMNGLKRD